jgi:hypothetical protein
MEGLFGRMWKHCHFQMNVSFQNLEKDDVWKNNLLLDGLGF